MREEGEEGDNNLDVYGENGQEREYMGFRPQLNE